ncbi:flagellar filament capping protein FliD [Sporosarcina obsidiansis]|uniref:flagellar filament capping protein FliD n=1 Tax=Sporosarcina obsidiansis TaxID=2660748 RepID=UPI00129BDA17|nr:flagellar filament capping protein FliD [Sporosarcina obsidiansis]
MRIGGLASGMDTETIIRDMMKAHRIPLDKITQKKQYTTWQMEDYRSTNLDLRKLSDKLLDNVILQKNYMYKNVNVSDENAVSIRSVSGSSDFSGTLEVKQLAKQANLQGGEIHLNGKTDKLTDAEIKTVKLSELSDGLSSGEIIIKVPGKEEVKIELDAEDTIESALKKINKDGNVNAFYDSHTGTISMSAKESGEGYIEVSGSLAKALKIDAEVIVTGDKAETKGSVKSNNNGENAIFVFNGLETQRTSNTFQISGFEVTLKQKTDAPVTFSSSTDSDKVVDTVTQFVNDYNELIANLNSKIKEKNYRDFPPLSDEQKKDMKEKEIELWEEKAKSGTLRNDPAISSMLTNLRSIMTKVVETTDKDGNKIKMSLKDLGIEPSKSYSDNGKLTINEDKLREKIAENPNAVYDLIGREDKENPKNSGIAQDYRKEIQTAQKSITEKAGTSTAVNDTFALGRSLKNFDKQIERFEYKLQMMETRYWKQFNAMENAIQRANAQSAQLMQSFGGGM